MTDLPATWANMKFSDFGTWIGGGTPSKVNPRFWNGPIPWVSPKDMKTKIIRETIDGITEEAVENSAAKLVPAGSVLIVTRSGILAHTLPIAVTAIESTLNQDLKALALPDGISSEYIAWGMRAFEQRILDKCRKGGTTVHSIEMPRLASFELPIAPTNEQRRIVEKIEAMFDEIGKGVESLQTARATLRLYRQSVLKSAFEGRLTANWRAQNADKLEDPKTILGRLEKDRDGWHECEFQRWQDDVATWESDGSKGPKPRKPETFKPIGALTGAERAVLPEMPSSWVYVRLNDIANIGSGMSVSKARKLEDPVETPYLRVANVQRGHLDLAEIKTMPVEKSQLSALCLRTWDILFNEGGDRDKLGRGWIWEDQVEICITQNHVFRATPFRHDKGWSVFVSQWGNSYGRDYFEAGGKQTTNLASINKTVLKALPVPICSPAEQAEITRLLNARLEAADALEAEIDAALTRADALRQSILKKAFSGQLVAQDPEEEPASALLERIKTERAERDKAAKRDRKSASTRKPEVRRPTLTDLIEVLEKQKDWISAAKAAQELGIGDNSTSDDVEAFYRQLKDFVDDDTIEVERRGDEDWLRLATAEVS